MAAAVTMTPMRSGNAQPRLDSRNPSDSGYTHALLQRSLTGFSAPCAENPVKNRGVVRGAGVPLAYRAVS